MKAEQYREYLKNKGLAGTGFSGETRHGTALPADGFPGEDPDEEEYPGEEEYPEEEDEMSAEEIAEGRADAFADGDEAAEEAGGTPEEGPGNGAPQQVPNPHEAPEGVSGDDILEGIRALYGFDEFIALCEELHAMAPMVRERQLNSVVLNKGYLFVIEPGGGSTTAVWNLANLLSADHLVPVKLGVIEMGDITGEPPEELISRGLLRVLAQVTDRVVVLDLCNLLEHLTDVRFTTFLLQMQELMVTKRLIPVFQIPYVENDVIIRVQNAILDVMNLETVVFHPLSLEDSAIAAGRMMGALGYEADENAYWYFIRRYLEECSDGRAYGFKTIRKLADEMVYEKLRSVVSGSDDDSRLITGRSLPIRIALPRRKPMDELNALVGREETIRQLKTVLWEIRQARKEGKTGPVHLQFVGNPGTGKKRAAEIFCRLLVENELLDAGLFIERTGEDFRGYFEGQTGPLITRLCRDAAGSVLFIGSAGELADEEDEDGRSREVIHTLVLQMLSHPQDMVVILSDTPSEMKQLTEAYPQLNVAAPYRIEFPDYTKADLAALFLQMAEDVGLEAGEGLSEAVGSYFENLDDKVLADPEFANARYVRNLFEKTCSKYLTRVQREDPQSTVILARDFREAAVYGGSLNEKHRTRFRIGFHVEGEE